MDKKTEEIISGKSGELLEHLRVEAKTGKKVSELVKLIFDCLPIENRNPVFVMLNFRRAFNLSLRQVQEMHFASCVGGNSYTDEEIDQLIRPHIEEHFLNKQHEALDEQEKQ